MAAAQDIAPGGRNLNEYNRAMAAHLGGLITVWSAIVIAPLIVLLL